MTGFLIALECAVRHYGLPGPITTQARELIDPPKSGGVLYGGLALMMVALTWRQRAAALGAALGIDLVFWAVRRAAHITVTDGQDVFVHYSNIDMSGFRVLEEGQTVEFTVGAGQKGPQAESVRVVA